MEGLITRFDDHAPAVPDPRPQVGGGTQDGLWSVVSMKDGSTREKEAAMIAMRERGSG